MNDEPRHQSYGTPMSEWISLVGELDVDAVGLWQIVSAGRSGFGLEGAALVDFIRRSLLAHFAYGARPVRHVPGSGYLWTVQPQYGDEPEQMAEAIIAEWDAGGRPDPDPGGLWLAIPAISMQRI